MVMIDPEGKIVLVNAQTEKLFGYRRDELLGQPVDLLVPERFRGSIRSSATPFLPTPRCGPWASAAISMAGARTAVSSPSRSASTRSRPTRACGPQRHRGHHRKKAVRKGAA